MENLQKVANDCGGDDKVFVLQADVTNDEDLKRIIEETIKKFNRLDVLYDFLIFHICFLKKIIEFF